MLTSSVFRLILNLTKSKKLFIKKINKNRPKIYKLQKTVIKKCNLI